MKTLRHGLFMAIAAVFFMGCAVAQTQQAQSGDNSSRRERSRRARSSRQQAVQEFIDRPPLPKNDDEKKILAILDARFWNDIRRAKPISPE